MLSWCCPGRRPNSPSAAAAASPASAEPLQSAMTDVPYGEVDRCLRALAGASEGFGQAAIGGVNGAIFHVTSLAGNYVPYRGPTPPQKASFTE